MTATDDVTRLKAGLTHPVIDSDGHLIESPRLFAGYLERVGGAELVHRVHAQQARLHSAGDAGRGDGRRWWGTTNVADDLAAVMLPSILAERMERLGIDFAIVYPTAGLALPTIPDDHCRRAACRAANIMHAELAAGCERVLTVAACIPAHTPDEAVDELTYCVRTLGMKVAMLPPGVARPLPEHTSAFPAARATDRYGVDSAMDYEPMWSAFAELGVAPTMHGAPGLRYLDCGSSSPSSYVYNHIGGHAFQQSQVCKSLVLGGVAARHPELRFGFLEGGAGWALELLGSLEEHWEKRSVAGLGAYDPARLDHRRLNELLAGKGHGGIGPGPSYRRRRPDPRVRDEFEDAAIGDGAEFARVFERQFFLGCESDDRSVYRALDRRGNAGNVRLNAMFSSDIGHWDVPVIDDVLLVSRELWASGLLTDEDYRDFAFANVVRLHRAMNPRFFEGTNVEAPAAAVAL